MIISKTIETISPILLSVVLIAYLMIVELGNERINDYSYMLFDRDDIKNS